MKTEEKQKNIDRIPVFCLEISGDKETYLHSAAAGNPIQLTGEAKIS